MSYYLCDSAGKQIPIGLSMRIGSDPLNQVVLQDPLVSDLHAILGELPDGLLIRDENSASGTFVNDERISAVTKLKTGDRIKLGGVEFLVGSTEPVLSETTKIQPVVEAVQMATPGVQEVQEMVQPEPLIVPDVPVISQPASPNVTEPSQTVRSKSSQADLPSTPPLPPPLKVTVQVQPEAKSSAATVVLPVKEKKSGGCLKWGLTIFLVLILGCVVLGGGGYLLLRAGIIPMRMIENAMGSGSAQIAIYNFSDQTAYIRIQQKFEDENTVTMPHIYWDLAPNDSKTDMSFTGTNEREIMTIGTTKDGNELGTCIFVPRQTDDYYIVILPDKVLIDNILFPESTDKPPASGNDLILTTSSICE